MTVFHYPKKRGKSYLVFQGSALPVPSKMTWIDDLKIALILNAINLLSSGMGLTKLKNWFGG